MMPAAKPVDVQSVPLPEGWSWKGQDEVFSFQGGAQPPKSAFIDEPRDGYVRLIQIRDYASDAHLTYVPCAPRLRMCAAEDVMIARYGSSAGGQTDSLGRICRGIEGAFNVALVRADPRPDVLRDFLYYLLQSRYFQDPLVGQSTRSVQAGFSRASLRHILLPTPPLPTQRAIAEVLGALDDKIAANQNVARAADELASALAAREMSESSRLEDIAELVMGSSPRGESLNEQGNGVEFFQGVRDFGVRVPASRVSTTEPTRLAQDGDVLLSVRAPVGRVNRADRTMCVGRGLAAIRSGFPNAILHALKLATAWESFNGEGTVFGSIAGPQLRSVILPWPPADRVASLELMLKPLEARIDSAVSESAHLAELRDTLLPHLMSGRLSVRDAEAQVEAVL